MNSIARRAASALLLLATFAAACSGSDATAADPDAATSEPDAVWTPEPSATPVAEPTAPTVGTGATPTPAPTATPQPVAENDVLRAAVDAYENAPLPPETRSFDVVSRSVRADGTVGLTVCTWDGRGVDNRVVELIYEVEGDTAGDLVATAATSADAGDTCINSDMLEGALEFIDEDQVQTAAEMSALAPWLDRRLPADLLVAPAWRRIDESTLDIGYCVEMHPGAPAGDAESNGDHLVRWVRLAFDVDARPQWSVVDADHLSWRDCRAAASWPRVVIDWLPGGVWRLTD